MDAKSFNLIIEKINEKNKDAAIIEIAKSFNLPIHTSSYIVESVPIIFIKNLSKYEVRLLKNNLLELSKHGIDFRVTTDSLKLPEVQWPAKPKIIFGDFKSNGVSINFNNTGFCCPNCGETFVIKKVSKLIEETESIEASSHEEKLIESLDNLFSFKGSLPKESTQKASAEKEEQKLNFSTSSYKDTSDPLATVKLNIDDASALDEPKSDELVVQETSSDEISLDSEVELKDTNLEPLPDLPELSLEQQPDIQIEKKEITTTTTKQTTTVTTGEKYNVFVSSVKDSSKKKDLIKIICEYRSVPESEADKLTKRLIIPVAKDVDKDKADEILSKLKKVNISGRKTAS